MIDESGTLHCFFGYGDSQLVNESVDIKDLLQNPIIQKNKITKTENIPAHSAPTPSLQNYTKIPRPRQMKDNTKEIRSSNSLQRIIGRRDNMEFNMYNPINDSQSPMYSTDLNIPSNIYPEKVKNIRSIRAQINNPDINSKYNMQYDNFFHLRNSPKNTIPKMFANSLSRTEKDLPIKFTGTKLSPARRLDELPYPPSFKQERHLNSFNL